MTVDALIYEFPVALHVGINFQVTEVGVHGIIPVDIEDDGPFDSH